MSDMSNPPQSPVDWEDVPPPAAGAGHAAPAPGRAAPAAGRTSAAGAPRASRPRRRVDVWTVVRVVVMVFGLFSLAYWGYISWAFPSPAVVFMVGAPVFAALVWFFFRSPRSPIPTDAVGKTIVEVALIVAAGGAWLSIGRPWVGLVFIVVAAVSGIVVGRRETAP